MRAALVLAVASLTGCATPVFKVELNPPPPRASQIEVSDNRLDTTVTMNMSSAYGAGQFVHVEPSPPLTESLARWVAAERMGTAPLTISIERLELVFKAGFGTTDDLACGIESTVAAGPGGPRTVRTRTRNTENLSPLVSTAGKVILSQCLAAHAKDLALAVDQ